MAFQVLGYIPPGEPRNATPIAEELGMENQFLSSVSNAFPVPHA